MLESNLDTRKAMQVTVEVEWAAGQGDFIVCRTGKRPEQQQQQQQGEPSAAAAVQPVLAKEPLQSDLVRPHCHRSPSFMLAALHASAPALWPMLSGGSGPSVYVRQASTASAELHTIL